MILVLCVIYIIFIALGLPDSLLGVVWPVVHIEFGLPESFASVFSIIVSFGTSGASFVAGMLLRKFGTAKVALASILITAIGLVGISLSPNIVLMIIFSVILGYGAGAIDTGLNNFVSLHYKASHMNFLHCFWGVGVTVSPLIMSAFLGDGEGSWRSGYRIVALLQIIIGVIALVAFKKWEAIEKGSAESESTEEKSGKTLREVLRMKGVLTSILSLGFYCGMEFLMGTWGATFAVNVFSLSPADAAKWVSLIYGGIMLGRFVAGFASMKLNDNQMIKSGMLIAFIGIVFLALPIGKASLYGFLVIGFGFGPVFPSILHSIPDKFGKEFSADITGFHMGGAYTIGFAVQMIFGFVASATTFKITPFVLMCVCAIMVLMNESTLKTLKKLK